MNLVGEKGMEGVDAVAGLGACNTDIRRLEEKQEGSCLDYCCRAGSVDIVDGDKGYMPATAGYMAEPAVGACFDVDSSTETGAL